jgi:hypothetical protein
MAYISKDEVKNVREMLKKEFPKFKFAVAGGNSNSLSVSIMKGPEDFSEITDKWSNASINEFHLYQYGRFEKLFAKMLKVMKSQNWFDESDSMTDYFHIAYYLHLSIGKWNKPYVQVK